MTGLPQASTNAMPNEHRLATSDDALRHRAKHGGRPSSAGFSIVELLVVMAIVMVVTAFAIPTITTTMDGIRLRGTTGSATNIAQSCRMQAANRNLYHPLHLPTPAT